MPRGAVSDVVRAGPCWRQWQATFSTWDPRQGETSRRFCWSGAMSVCSYMVFTLPFCADPEAGWRGMVSRVQTNPQSHVSTATAKVPMVPSAVCCQSHP